MGAHQSKDELLYHQVVCGNVEGIKTLRRDGAGLEWVDKVGRTPLVMACTRPDLLPVVKVLIELGANVNSYHHGGHAGTPLHQAAKRGLSQTVDLLLSNGANPLLLNHDSRTALDLARAKGHCNVVRALESRICLFSGWMRELHAPGILETFIPQWASRKIWVVVLPCLSHNAMGPSKFQLALYPDLQAAKPRTTIALWKCHVGQINFGQSDPAILIEDMVGKTRYRFSSAQVGDKQQLVSFLSACRGVFQLNNNVPVTPIVAPTPISSQFNNNAPATPIVAPAPVFAQLNNNVPATPIVAPTPVAPAPISAQLNNNVPATPIVAPTPISSRLNPHPSMTQPMTSSQEDIELAMAINASIQSAIAEGVPVSDVQPVAIRNSSIRNGWIPPTGAAFSEVHETRQSGFCPSASSSQIHQTQSHLPATVPSATQPSSAPSAPPMISESFRYVPVGRTVAPMDNKPVNATVGNEANGFSPGSCVICLDAPVEAACIPCGHMAGCISCLNEIKAKKWGCPICRADIDQVIKLYAV